MIVRQEERRPWGLPLALLAVWLLVATATTAAAAWTQSWKETPEGLYRGEADSVALTSKGHLFLAPRVGPVSDEALPGEPAQVWSVAADASGNLYLGTGPDGKVIRISPTGRQELFFAADEPLVTAVAVTSGGHVLAATSPGGKIYRVAPDGSGELWCETEERYVWALVPATDGTVYAGTGENGAVLAIDSRGNAEPFFVSDESHIMALELQPDGSLLAGGAGRGGVYRIDPDGHALVLYEDDLAEVVDVTTDSEGNVIAALTAAPSPETKRPAVRIQLPSGTQVGPVDDGVSNLEESPHTTLRGEIEGLPQDKDRNGVRQSGRLVRIDERGQATVIWRSSAEAPFGLARDHTGRVLLGTGEPARLYRLDDDDELARLSTFQEAQLTALIPIGRSIFLATSNPAAVYRLDRQAADGGRFLSRAFDAGGLARWGSIRWSSHGSAERLEFYTRTGNSERPDETWSGWSPALVDRTAGAVVNPDGRYLQWRARFLGGVESNTRISDVAVSYEPYNRPPELREFYLESAHAAVSGDATFRWATYDPDLDPVELIVEYRRAGEPGADWSVLPREPAEPANEDAKVVWEKERLTLKSGLLDEGTYELRLTVSDQAGNPPGEGRHVVARRGERLIIDRTPPELRVAPGADGQLELTLSDAYSDITRLEVLAGEQVRFRLRPLDGLCDSARELFRFELPAGENAGDWTLRGIDSAGNKVEAPLVGP